MEERLIFFIYMCSSIFSISGSSLRCQNDLTTVIESVHSNGSTYSGNFSNFERVNDTHLKVCQCDIKSCLKKCCGMGQIIANDVCVDIPREIANYETMLLPQDNLSNYYLIHGNGCPVNYFTRFYPDDYTNVKYHLTENGFMSVYFDNDVRQIQDFCLERVFHSGNSTKFLICIPNNISSGFYEFPVGMVLSLPFLAVTVVIYSFRELRNIHGKNLISHVASLLTAYLSVILVEITKSTIPENLCIALGFVRQFSFLSSFFWLNVMCFDLWWSLSSSSGFKAHSREKERKKFILYSSCGWGCPAAIVLVTSIMEFFATSENIIKPGIGLSNCFLQDGKPFYAYFYGPVIFIFCVDVTLIILSAVRFVIVARKMKLASIHDKIYIQSAKTRYFLVLKIFIMMGINWIIDPFSWIFESSLWTWLFIQASITLQSITMFYMFVWKPEVKHIIVSKFCANSYRETTSISLLHTTPPNSCTTKLKRNNLTQNTTSC